MANYWDHWAEAPGYPVADWKAAVANDETRLGYWDWIEQQEDMREAR